MNVDTGQMGPIENVLRDAQPGERVIPATIIPAPGKYANKQGYPSDVEHGRAMKQAIDDATQTIAQIRPLYGPRKPLREVRAELAAKATEA